MWRGVAGRRVKRNCLGIGKSVGGLLLIVTGGVVFCVALPVIMWTTFALARITRSPISDFFASRATCVVLVGMVVARRVARVLACGRGVRCRRILRT